MGPDLHKKNDHLWFGLLVHPHFIYYSLSSLQQKHQHRLCHGDRQKVVPLRLVVSEQFFCLKTTTVLIRGNMPMINCGSGVKRSRYSQYKQSRHKIAQQLCEGPKSWLAPTVQTCWVWCFTCYRWQTTGKFLTKALGRRVIRYCYWLPILAKMLDQALMSTCTDLIQHHFIVRKQLYYIQAVPSKLVCN